MKVKVDLVVKVKLNEAFSLHIVNADAEWRCGPCILNHGASWGKLIAVSAR